MTGDLAISARNYPGGRVRDLLTCFRPKSSREYSRRCTRALPVVVDAASCTLGLKDDILEHLDDERKDRLNLITIIDSIAWCKDLLPH